MIEVDYSKKLQVLSEDKVFRQVATSYLTHAKGNKTERFPRENHFSPDSDGLSVNWDRFSNVSYNYHIIGLTYKYKQPGIYKDFRNFHVFKIPVTILKSIEGINSIDHNPIFNGNPAPLGSPNNYAHTLVVYDDDPEIRLKLSDWCRDYHSESYCQVDFGLLETEIEELRQRLNTTVYHVVN